MTRTRSTPEQMVAKLEAKLAAARSKAEGKEIAPSSPEGAALLALEKEETLLRKDLADGPQGAAFRLRVHELWIAEIQARISYAQARLPELLRWKATIREGGEIPHTSEFSDLATAWSDAVSARKGNTAARKGEANASAEAE